MYLPYFIGLCHGLVTNLPVLRPGFSLRLLYVGFVVNEMALGQFFFLQVF